MIVGDFNNTITRDSSFKPKSNKETVSLRDTLDSMDEQIWKTFYPRTENTFFQVDMEHSPGYTTY